MRGMNENEGMLESQYAIQRGGQSRALAEFGKRRERRFAEPPQIALVVATFTAVPYVHLHLEARRRLYPDVPLLVHDDHSPKAAELEALCHSYGADFEQTATRLPPCKGDLSAFVGGLAWARERGAGLLVKMSRRFVPTMRWVEGLARLARESDYGTCSSWTTSFNFGFRTECLALGVEDWLGHADEIIDAIFAEKEPFVEAFMHGLARRIASGNSRAAQAYDARVGQRPGDRNGYAVWPFIGTDRRAPSCDHLWHDWASPEDYAALAGRWGLPYVAKDFADPNMGFGSRPNASPANVAQSDDGSPSTVPMAVPRVAVYAVCHNEEVLIPYFVRNYEWAERIVIYDDASTDRTREILRGFPRVEVRAFDTGGVLDNGILLDFKNRCWKECRGGGFDWVIVVDIDEFVWAPNLPGRLRDWRSEGYSIIRPRGYAMVSQALPVANAALPEHCKRGVPDEGYSKPCIFNPGKISEIQFTPGAHDCRPAGDVRELRTDEAKLLHYRLLNMDMVLARARIRQKRQSAADHRRGWGFQHRWSEDRWRQEFATILARSTEII